MELSNKISTQIIQLFTSSMAWEYKLVPFSDTDKICCYGSKDIDYSKSIIDLEVFFGKHLDVNIVSSEQLDKLLFTYYAKNQQNIGDLNGNIIQNTSKESFFNKIVREAHQAYASDIHMEPYESKCRIRFRIDGVLVEKYILDKSQYASLINQIKILANLDISEKRLPQDGRILYKKENNKFDVRVSSLPTIYGEKLVLRLLTRHVELLEITQLGFSKRQLEDYIRAVSKPHGLILISGPTGSGKSTTLYATLIKLNNSIKNILTIEDPIEYTLEGVNQVQLKEEIGLTFSSALRTFLRQDPDIIMLGEIRDSDTSQMAIRSSLTGHLILSTLHTNSAWGCISRLKDMGAHPYLISDTLVLCVAQRLIRTLCTKCEKKGCRECNYTGYKGRKAIYEVIPIDNELKQAIREDNSEVAGILKSKGITTLQESALELLNNGETSMEEIQPILENIKN